MVIFRETVSHSVPPQRAMLVTVDSTDLLLPIWEHTLHQHPAVGRRQGKVIMSAPRLLSHRELG